MARYWKSKTSMPINYHEQDGEFIESMLLKIHPSFHTKACVGYNEAYNDEFGSEPVQHKKKNAARRAANIKLRKFANAVIESAKPEIRKAIQRPQANFCIDDL